jgi:hypothetical protein
MSNIASNSTMSANSRKTSKESANRKDLPEKSSKAAIPLGDSDSKDFIDTTETRIHELDQLIRAGTTFLTRTDPLQHIRASQNLGKELNRKLEGLDRGATLFATQKEGGVACIVMKQSTGATQIITTGSESSTDIEEMFTLGNSTGGDNVDQDNVSIVRPLPRPSVDDVNLDNWFKKFLKNVSISPKFQTHCCTHLTM